MISPKSFKIAIAQINPIVGDFEGNLKKHLKAIQEAKHQGARLIVFSELSFVGYIPRDLLLEPHFLQHQNRWLHELASHIDDIYVLLGAVTKNPSGIEKPFFNSALCFYKGKQIFQYDKRLLPTYDVFDEHRYFEEGTSSGVLEIEGLRIGLSICEDMWQHTHATKGTCYRQDPILDLGTKSFDLLINMSGSPYVQDKIAIRRKILHSLSSQFKCPMIYTNQVGSNDAIIFDGYSMLMYPDGDVFYAKGFSEDLKVFDLIKKTTILTRDFSSDLEKALVLGIRDYVTKNGFNHVVIGLSGGIDSAVVLALCQEALGSDRVKTIYMPSRHSSPLSQSLASTLALNFNVSLDVVNIDRLIDAYIDSLEGPLNISSKGITFENIQSRIRGNIIMAYANRYGALMMGCSNKSELAVGYGTIYGDIAGALLPIGDLLKVDVYKLAHKISRKRIPDQVFTRAPSAELYLNQQDTDSLPPYEILDPILKLYIEKGKSRDEILDAHPEFYPHIDHIIHLFKISEFKRYQAPMILKVSKRNFGTGWDFPITRK